MSKTLILFDSLTVFKNTAQVARGLSERFIAKGVVHDLIHVKDFNMDALGDYSTVIIGTYSWGDGEIPERMHPVFKHFEDHPSSHVVTGVFGTGDTFYPHYCGAVDRFRDMLNAKTNLAVTLKVELSPQEKDFIKMDKFVSLILQRVEGL